MATRKTSMPRDQNNSAGMTWKQERKYTVEEDPRWSAEANRKRAEYMRGKHISLETRAAMSATRRNPGDDSSDPRWDQELWERDRQAFIDKITNRERFLKRLNRAPQKTASQIRTYFDLFYHQLRTIFVGETVDFERLEKAVEQGQIDDVLAHWINEYAD